MSLEEFEIDGKKILLNNDFKKEETGIAYLEEEEDELDKTAEIKVINDEDFDDNTLIDIFGEENHE